MEHISDILSSLDIMESGIRNTCVECGYKFHRVCPECLKRKIYTDKYLDQIKH